MRFTPKIACSLIPARESTGAGTRSTASRAPSRLHTQTFDISQFPSPRNRATAGLSDGSQAARVRHRLTPGLISSLPGTGGLPPFICFSTSYLELELPCRGTAKEWNARSERSSWESGADRLGLFRSAPQSDRPFEHDRIKFIATF